MRDEEGPYVKGEVTSSRRSSESITLQICLIQEIFCVREQQGRSGQFLMAKGARYIDNLEWRLYGRSRLRATLFQCCG